MKTSFGIAGVNAKTGSAKTYTRNEHSGTASVQIANVFRHLYQRKVWVEVSARLSLQERAAKHRLAGTREFTVDELATLLRSDEGIHFLARLMGDAQPRWWRGFLANTAAGDARRALRQHRQRLHEAMDAVESLDDTIVRAEAALAFQDEDFMRPQLDARCEVARTGYRALARATKRG